MRGGQLRVLKMVGVEPQLFLALYGADFFFLCCFICSSVSALGNGRMGGEKRYVDFPLSFLLPTTTPFNSLVSPIVMLI